MEKRLFVITNPTHYLNVKSYISNKSNAENYIYLITRSFKGQNDFIKKIEDDSDIKLLGSIVTKKDSRISEYFLLFKNFFEIKKIAKAHPYFDKIIFSNYKSYNQHLIINQFKTNQKIILSDGAGILLIAEDRKKSKNIPFKAAPFYGNKFLLKNIFGISNIKKLHFYSPIQMNLAEDDSLEIFTYSSSSNVQVNKQSIFFIGSPLVENEFLNFKNYIDYLKKVQQQFPDYEITYYAHRRESEENLKKYDFLGQVIRNEIPFEELLMKMEKLPCYIISFISSVLLNLYPVYPQINFYYIELQRIEAAKNPQFAKNYEILKNKFEEINVSNFRSLFKVNGGK